MHVLARKRDEGSPEFPHVTGDFVFVRELEVSSRALNYFFGLYKSADGRFAVLKLWDKTLCTKFARTLLVREIANYKALQQLSPGIDALPGYYHIPHFYGALVSTRVCWLLIEHIQVVSENSLTAQDFEAVQSYLATIGRLPGAAKRFKSVNPWGLLIGFIPGLICVSLSSHVFRRHALSLLRNFFSAVMALCRPGQKQLLHLDLKPENILNGSNGVYVIDFEFLAFANPLYELAFSWDRAFVIRESNEEVVNLINTLVFGLSARDRVVVRIWVVYGMIYDMLIDREVPISTHEQALEKLVLL